jgi:hypothetical protein
VNGKKERKKGGKESGKSYIPKRAIWADRRGKVRRVDGISRQSIKEYVHHAKGRKEFG